MKQIWSYREPVIGQSKSERIFRTVVDELMEADGGLLHLLR